jgi:hypothetical protein
MKLAFFTLALMGVTSLSAQNKPLTIHFLPIFSAGKVVSSQTNANIGNAGYSKTNEKSSKQIKSKNVMRFGEYTVSDASFNNTAVETSASYFLKYVNSKINTNSLFTVHAAQKKAIVTTADDVRMEGIGSAAWTDLLVPFKARLVQTGIIKIDSLHWEYFVEDKNFISNSKEEVIGYLSNGKNQIAIKLHNRSLSFYEGNRQLAVLKFPIFKSSTLWFEETLDADTKLAIAAISSSALFKVRGIQQMD